MERDRAREKRRERDSNRLKGNIIENERITKKIERAK